MLRHALLLGLAGLLLAAAPATAQRLKPEPDLATSAEDLQRYQQCLQLAEKKPADGFEAAMQWRDSSGSNAAKQCVAAALFYLDEPEEAATRLEELALGMRAARPELRARLLSQAGTAWSVANQPERANAAITTAIQMMPTLPDLYVDRAMVLAQAKNYWEAID
ncbi:MAG: hypothetical protein JO128_18895, partial [Alphaproteobacteria bacterium]|nr:hypothetical protein [Alphaproteobacteria bacterium]